MPFSLLFNLDCILALLLILLIVKLDHAVQLLFLELLVPRNLVSHTLGLFYLPLDLRFLRLKQLDATFDDDCIFISFFSRID